MSCDRHGVGRGYNPLMYNIAMNSQHLWPDWHLHCKFRTRSSGKGWIQSLFQESYAQAIHLYIKYQPFNVIKWFSKIGVYAIVSEFLSQAILLTQVVQGSDRRWRDGVSDPPKVRLVEEETRKPNTPWDWYIM